jgi:soluble lytic murein transglycosylase
MALAAASQPAAAREAWGIAAGYPVAFYGQLGGLALGEGPDRLAQRIRNIAQPAATPAQTASFMNREVARIIPLLAEMGEGRRARAFLLRIEELSTQPWERTLLMQLANRSGRPENPVWVARRAGASGAMLVPDGWPSPYPTEGLAIEPALTKAITRQESNFDTEALSSANARGLMQLLPATAQQVARRLNTPHQLPWLQANPAHNLRLGSAYLDQMIGRFGGTWPFAIAAYNAGPGRVDEWLQTYGDPRQGRPAMLDWMEQIPFGETRNYVQRVMENVAVYRALAGVNAPHPMAAWLR